jgi:hypothetical protein
MRRGNQNGEIDVLERAAFKVVIGARVSSNSTDIRVLGASSIVRFRDTHIELDEFVTGAIIESDTQSSRGVRCEVTVLPLSIPLGSEEPETIAIDYPALYKSSDGSATDGVSMEDVFEMESETHHGRAEGRGFDCPYHLFLRPLTLFFEPPQPALRVSLAGYSTS